MKSLAVEEPEHLFPARRDAVLYLIGLGGFWGGIAACALAADAALPSSILLVFVAAAIGGWYLLMKATRKFENRINGRSVRPWPFGYASLRIQVIASLPSTVMAAAQRLQWNALIVTVVIYALLIIGLVALAAWPTTR